MSSLDLSRRAFLAASTAAIAGSFPAFAATGSGALVVVELFTSQGCSSCPPADAFLRELSRRPGVLALTYNVDYWDYIGWRDTLASPDYSRRQRDYAARRGDGEVYTPQMVINGKHHVVGSKRERVLELIEREAHRPAPTGGDISLASDDQELIVNVTDAAANGQEDCTVWFLTINPSVAVAIERGENAGRQITYTNVVRQMMPVAMWHGEAKRLTLPRSELFVKGATGCAGLIQVGGVGPILDAAAIGAVTT